MGLDFGVVIMNGLFCCCAVLGLVRYLHVGLSGCKILRVEWL